MAIIIARQPFSSYTFPKMKVLFGLKADDYNELPTFIGGKKEIPEEIRNLVIGEFLRLHKTSNISLAPMKLPVANLFPVSFMVWHQYMEVK